LVRVALHFLFYITIGVEAMPGYVVSSLGHIAQGMSASGSSVFLKCLVEQVGGKDVIPAVRYKLVSDAILIPYPTQLALKPSLCPFLHSVLKRCVRT